MPETSPAEAPATAPPTPESRPVAVRIRELPLARRAVFAGFATLVVLGAAFYVWWGMAFGVWIDNGVYAVFITLVLFGLAGMWLVLPEPPARSPESA